ncbi:hypothetical protein FHG87_016503, partial [Trinorchestia longiramus]
SPKAEEGTVRAAVPPKRLSVGSIISTTGLASIKDLSIPLLKKEKKTPLILPGKEKEEGGMTDGSDICVSEASSVLPGAPTSTWGEGGVSVQELAKIELQV